MSCALICGDERRLLERLELDQQLVDHAGDALARCRRPPPRAPPMASISSMKPMAPPSRRAYLRSALKYGPDLAVGLAVEHGLEGRRRDEEERHAGLGGHGFGHVGLARSRGTLEEDGPARRATHLLGEAPVGRKRLRVLMTSSTRPSGATDIVEAHGHLVRAEEDVGGAPGAQQGNHHDQTEHDDEQPSPEAAARGTAGKCGKWNELPPGSKRSRSDQEEGQRRQQPCTGVATGCSGPGAGGHRRR